MAIVKDIEIIKGINRVSEPKSTDGRYSVKIINGEKFAVLQTNGSGDRPDRSWNQTIHIDKEMAIRLIELLKDSFDIE